MNLEQLQGFVTVARVGNFTRAAADLHLTQPSLSRQIAALEADLGAALFHRAHAGTTVTAAGAALLPFAGRMLADAASARLELAALADLSKGHVRLGATPTLCITLVPEILAEFHAQHPGIELTLSERGSRDLVAQLERGELDLALTTESAIDADTQLRVTPLLREELIVVCSRAHPRFGDDDAVALASLEGMPFIRYGAAYDLRAATDAALREAGVTPQVVVEGAEMDAVLRFVERGIGVSIAPASVLVDRPGLRGVRLRGQRLERTVTLARAAGLPLSAAAEAMQRTIRQSAREFAERSGATVRPISPTEPHPKR